MRKNCVHCNIDENFIFDSWLSLKSQESETPSTQKKEFCFYLHLFTSYDSNKVKSVNCIVVLTADSFPAVHVYNMNDFAAIIFRRYFTLNAWDTISQILWQTTCWYQICRFWHYRKIFYRNIHNQGKWNNPSFNQISFVPWGFNSIYAEYTAGIFMQHPKLSNSPLQLWIWCHYLQDDRQSCDLPNRPMSCEDDTLMWRSFPPNSQHQMGHNTL